MSVRERLFFGLLKFQLIKWEGPIHSSPFLIRGCCLGGSVNLSDTKQAASAHEGDKRCCLFSVINANQDYNC